jgi:3-phosphoshikimate 1-carboxyvinyltransferase
VTSVEIVGGQPLRGTLRVPGDKSISHRALLVAALAPGASKIRGLSDGDDVARTRAAVEQLGAAVLDDGNGAIRVTGGMLREPHSVVEVGNSGTSIRLLAGLCAGLPFLTVLQGDDSIARRPMDRVAEPLRAMGATVDGRDLGRFAPLVVRGGELHGIDYTMPVASAQVKSAVLFAGLNADGVITVRESSPTRAHTEELLTQAGIAVSCLEGRVTLEPGEPHPIDLDVPGDPSQAAFWLVAACLVPGSEVEVEDVYVGPARTGFVDVLGRMGADIEVRDGSIRAVASDLTGTTVDAHEIPGLVDEVPVLAVAAALADGETRFRGVGELRVKESDRLATVVVELGALGARVEASEDELVVQGGTLHGDRVRSHGDHRIAMAMAIAGCALAEPTTVEGWEAVATSYPAFESDLRRLTAPGTH